MTLNKAQAQALLDGDMVVRLWNYDTPNSGLTYGPEFLTEAGDLLQSVLKAYIAQSEELERVTEALEAGCEAIRKARAMVPDDEEGLAAQVFAYHLNMAETEMRCATLKENAQ